MTSNPVCLVLIVMALVANTACISGGNSEPKGRILEFDDTLTDWVVEQQPGGSVVVEDGALLIDDQKGCTVWYRHKLTTPLRIRYAATVSSGSRVSDLNCFWMASDLDHLDDLFVDGHGREGAFAQYDDLQLYYVGYGGNHNSTTRFRRYKGRGEKPLLPEFDLTGEEHLLAGDHSYQIELVADGKKAQYFRDGELIFEYEDPEPLLEGWFGIRTVWSKIRIENLEVFEGEEER